MIFWRENGPAVRDDFPTKISYIYTHVNMHVYVYIYFSEIILYVTIFLIIKINPTNRLGRHALR